MRLLTGICLLIEDCGLIIQPVPRRRRYRRRRRRRLQGRGLRWSSRGGGGGDAGGGGRTRLPCSERLREERVAYPARSHRSQYASGGAFASQAFPFIAGATCAPSASNRGPGSWALSRRAGAEARPPWTPPHGGRRRCEPVDEWRNAGTRASSERGRERKEEKLEDAGSLA